MSLNSYSNDHENDMYYMYIKGHKENDWKGCRPCPPHPHVQEHVHEVQGSVEIAERGTDPHNHRFATVTGEAKPCGKHDHFHEIKFRTDFYENHYHEFCGRTGGAIKVGDRHVHFLESVTEVSDNHQHDFRLSTFINDPIGEEA